MPSRGPRVGPSFPIRRFMPVKLKKERLNRAASPDFVSCVFLLPRESRSFSQNSAPQGSPTYFEVSARLLDRRLDLCDLV